MSINTSEVPRHRLLYAPTTRSSAVKRVVEVEGIRDAITHLRSSHDHSAEGVKLGHRDRRRRRLVGRLTVFGPKDDALQRPSRALVRLVRNESSGDARIDGVV
jgi:hypothetical protein